MNHLPEPFKSNIADILGEKKVDFFDSLSLETPVSIRKNPSKEINLDHLDIDAPVQWCKDGFYLKNRPAFTLDPLFHGGAYYVQEASSMFLEEVFKQTCPQKSNLKVLDLCGAPGGKSTHLASMLGNDDLLVSNEVIKSRTGVLKENMQKWGFPNSIISSQDPETFSDLEGFFDVVVVDAPCSGEGLFRKDKDAINEWSESHVQMCSLRQQRILSSASLLVSNGGVLIYSTCTYNKKENQDNADWLCRTFDFEPIEIQINENWNIVRVGKGNQFFPHLVRGEGFFIAAFRKTGKEPRALKGKLHLQRLNRQLFSKIESWIDENEIGNYDFFQKNDGNVVALRTSLLSEYGVLLKSLQKRSSGLEIGIFKGSDFIPSHALVLSTIVSKKIPFVDLEKIEALKFLKKESFNMPENLPDGWIVVKHQGLNLGWIKKIGNRVNNYLPTEWRIRMDIEL